MRETVVPPYSMAYTTLNERIVQKLLTADTGSDQATIKKLVNSLLCAAKKVHNELRQATEASEQIRNTLDEQIGQLVLSVSNQEQQVRQSQEAVNHANNNIQSTQHQVTVAEAAVRNSQHSLNVANNAVHEANAAVNKARRCGVGRRKKRFLGFLKPLNPVRIVCSVVNSGGINNAKERRGLAEQNLHQSHQRLHAHQQTLAAQQAQYNAAQAQLNAANTQLQTITSALNEQRTKQSLVTSLITQLKGVEVHLNTVLGSSTVLKDEITQLIDFELVIEPLNSTYHEMLKSNIMEPFGFEISADTSRQITANLKKLTEILPNMPLNEMLITDSEVGC
jgi:chromosome segregation ATPase